MTLGWAICWTLILITNIVNAVSGAAPTWVAVFCPLSVLAVYCWADYIDKKADGRR